MGMWSDMWWVYVIGSDKNVVGLGTWWIGVVYVVIMS